MISGVMIMENNIMAWSFDKPKEPGLYMACRGDVESEQNIEPVKIVESCIYDYEVAKESNTWPTYTAEMVEKWHSSFKFARLVVG